MQSYTESGGSCNWLSQSLGQEIKENSENITVPTNYWGTEERAGLPIKAVLFHVRDFHFFLVDSYGFGPSNRQDEKNGFELHNAAGDVILSCDSKLQF